MLPINCKFRFIVKFKKKKLAAFEEILKFEIKIKNIDFRFFN